MKAPEFYVNELLILIQSTQLAFNTLERGWQEDHKRTKRQMFFCPWAKQSIASAFCVRSNITLELLKDLRELREKLLESTGVDEDMQPITLKTMLKIND